MRTFINTCGIVAVIIGLLTFSMQNTHDVTVTYYNGIALVFPAWGIILMPFFFGVIAGSLLDVIQRVRLKTEIKKLKKEFKGMRSE
ncbi:MAG: LapA family protein [Deltaproteobacteria bacterium]|nr:LapA family protein [Deltaproteobacteria bacterium]